MILTYVEMKLSAGLVNIMCLHCRFFVVKKQTREALRMRLVVKKVTLLLKKTLENEENFLLRSTTVSLGLASGLTRIKAQAVAGA